MLKTIVAFSAGTSGHVKGTDWKLEPHCLQYALCRKGIEMLRASDDESQGLAANLGYMKHFFESSGSISRTEYWEEKTTSLRQAISSLSNPKPSREYTEGLFPHNNQNSKIQKTDLIYFSVLYLSKYIVKMRISTFAKGAWTFKAWFTLTCIIAWCVDAISVDVTAMGLPTAFINIYLSKKRTKVNLTAVYHHEKLYLSIKGQSSNHSFNKWHVPTA